METSNIENLLKEIDKLLQAKKLLQRVYIELGPYNNTLDRNLTKDINNYFEFDDNE